MNAATPLGSAVRARVYQIHRTHSMHWSRLPCPLVTICTAPAYQWDTVCRGRYGKVQCSRLPHGIVAPNRPHFISHLHNAKHINVPADMMPWP